MWKYEFLLFVMYTYLEWNVQFLQSMLSFLALFPPPSTGAAAWLFFLLVKTFSLEQLSVQHCTMKCTFELKHTLDLSQNPATPLYLTWISTYLRIGMLKSLLNPSLPDNCAAGLSWWNSWGAYRRCLVSRYGFILITNAVPVLRNELSKYWNIYFSLFNTAVF